MKKFKIAAYIILIIVIVVLSLNIYSNANKDNDSTQKEKVLSEIKFLDSKIMNLLNTIPDTGTTNKKEVNNYSLKSNGILANDNTINWDNIKAEVETLYVSVPTVTLDLYEIGLNQEDILAFNKELDNLTVTVKDEKKEETIDILSKLYSYIPKFSKNATDDEIYKTIVDVKSDIFKSYYNLEKDDWDAVSNDVKSAIDKFSKLLTNTTIEQSRQYNINKAYIMLNELQNATGLKDKEIFLIKYKNVLEEINSL